MADEKEGWTVETLKDHLIAIMGERDKRYEERFEASQKAVDTAFEASQKAVDTALEVVNKTKSNSLAVCVVICTVFGLILEVINFAFFAHR
jgi:hypothetical protein